MANKNADYDQHLMGVPPKQYPHDQIGGYEDERPVYRSTAQMDQDFKRLKILNPDIIDRANQDSLRESRGILWAIVGSFVFWSVFWVSVWKYAS